MKTLSELVEKFRAENGYQVVMNWHRDGEFPTVLRIWKETPEGPIGNVWRWTDVRFQTQELYGIPVGSSEMNSQEAAAILFCYASERFATTAVEWTEHREHLFWHFGQQETVRLRDQRQWMKSEVTV